MEKKTYHLSDIGDIDNVARQFVRDMGDETVYAFTGPMGAGKTTFISALCRALGVDEDDASSPSFSLVNEYRSSTTAELIYHFDLYRIESLDEALEIGVEDYLDSGALCLLEWPDRVEPILPEDTVNIEIKVNDDLSRDIIVG